MQCLACKEDIDDDSIYCDMCGVELSVCAQCRVPVVGKWCTKCGGQRVLASSLLPAVGQIRSPSDAVRSATGEGRAELSAAGAATGSGGTKRATVDAPISATHCSLRLRNRTLNLDLALSESTLVGRTAGPLLRTFAGFDQVSSKHCMLERDGKGGWQVTDLGSTNGTSYNNQIIPANRPQSLSNGSFLKVANIEFFVSIE